MTPFRATLRGFIKKIRRGPDMFGLRAGGGAIFSYCLENLDNLRLPGKRGPQYVRGYKAFWPILLVCACCQPRQQNISSVDRS